jgi:high affinity Mn2+ porin
MIRLLCVCILLIVGIPPAIAQENDSSSASKWSKHFQLTVISQSHSGFPAAYSGDKSLGSDAEAWATSLTTTLYIGRKLWKGGTLYFNPEMSGGHGLSYATGVAGALNGETYRVGAVEPQLFIARAYLEQHIPLGNSDYEWVEDDVNQVRERVPTSRITLTAGKFAIADFFDDNAYAKDPRAQFFNWSVWANGAWDYPANTRGYTFGLVAALYKPHWAIRLSTVAVPRIANFHIMEYNGQAHSETLEFQHDLLVGKRKGMIRILANNTYSRAPSYADGIKAIPANDSFLLHVIAGTESNTRYGGHKFGLGLNMDQELTEEIGLFARAGWNDGKYASWAFTEIDNSINAGLSGEGKKWKRPDAVWAIAVVSNGLSNDHRTFLASGGYGFIIGDGRLNYGRESIMETYYNMLLSPHFWLTFDYQFVNHPGYNKDRGPVHVFGIRGHIEL